MAPDLHSRRAAFLDRDGVINLDRGYVFRREDFQFIDGVLEASARLVQHGFALVVVTNQSGIGRGMYTESDFALLTAWMKLQFADSGAPLAGVYFCPHHPLDAHGVYRTQCDCRKPAPGMLLRAAGELHLDLPRSVMFGDRRDDLLAARTAGVPARVLLGKNAREQAAPVDGDLATARYRSLSEAVASPSLWTLLGETWHA